MVNKCFYDTAGKFLPEPQEFEWQCSSAPISRVQELTNTIATMLDGGCITTWLSMP